MITFKHSGNSGDLIYSLPCLKYHAKDNAKLYVAVDVPGQYGNNYHPMGNVMINTAMFDMLKPLLNFQPYIKEVAKWDGTTPDYDLDRFRTAGLDLSKGDIIRWYNHVYPFEADLTQPWIKPSAILPQYANKIVMVHSHRYHSPLINYMFMQKYQNDIIFLGVKKEHEDFCNKYFDVEFKAVDDFLDMANIIASGKLFVGNQTFGYSLAEAMKVNRLLEASPQAHNVHPHGLNSNFAFYQHHFENLFEQMLGKSKEKDLSLQQHFGC